MWEQEKEMGRRKLKKGEGVSEGRIYLRVPAALKKEIFEKAEREKTAVTDLTRGILQVFMNYWEDLEEKEGRKDFYRVASRLTKGDKDKCSQILDKNKK